MTHLSIDRQPDAVKQFFRSLALTPEGSVVEIRPASPVKDTAALAWVSVHVTHRGRSATLLGIAPAAPSPATQGAAK